MDEHLNVLPTRYNDSTFSNDIDKDKDIPRKRCAVWCKLLYPEEHKKLWAKHMEKLEGWFVGDRRAALSEGATVTEREK